MHSQHHLHSTSSHPVSLQRTQHIECSWLPCQSRFSLLWRLSNCRLVPDKLVTWVIFNIKNYMVRYLLVACWDWCTFLQRTEGFVLVQLDSFLFDCVTPQCVSFGLIQKEFLLNAKRNLHNKLDLNESRLDYSL